MTAPSPSLKVIHSAEAFQRLREDWNALAATTNLSVFARHEWYDAVLSWHDGAELFIVLASRDGRLSGIFPLQSGITPWRGLRLRTLSFLAVPDTQACGLIAAGEDQRQLLEATLALLLERNDWDVLDLRLIPHDSSLPRDLEQLARRHGLRFACTLQGSNYRIDCAIGGWDDYYRTRTRRLKKGNNLIANKLGRAFERIEVRRHAADDTADLEAILERIIAISAASWKSSTGLSLDRPAPRRFIECLSRHASEQGWLSVWELHLDGQAVAMEYQLAYGRRLFALRSDFRQDFEELSPGSYLNFQIIKSLFGGDSGVDAYLMGPGDNPYKRRWATAADDLYRATLYNRTLKGRVAGLAETGLKPLLRAMRPADAKEE